MSSFAVNSAVLPEKQSADMRDHIETTHLRGRDTAEMGEAGKIGTWQKLILSSIEKMAQPVKYESEFSPTRPDRAIAPDICGSSDEEYSMVIGNRADVQGAAGAANVLTASCAWNSLSAPAGVPRHCIEGSPAIAGKLRIRHVPWPLDRKPGSHAAEHRDASAREAHTRFEVRIGDDNLTGALSVAFAGWHPAPGQLVEALSGRKDSRFAVGSGRRFGNVEEDAGGKIATFSQSSVPSGECNKVFSVQSLPEPSTKTITASAGAVSKAQETNWIGPRLSTASPACNSFQSLSADSGLRLPVRRLETAGMLHTVPSNTQTPVRISPFAETSTSSSKAGSHVNDHDVSDKAVSSRIGVFGRIDTDQHLPFVNPSCGLGRAGTEGTWHARNALEPVPQQDPIVLLEGASDLKAMRWIKADVHRAEAGFHDPSLGWISVRAELGPGGVHASVIPSSISAAQVLGAHVGVLSAHLEQQGMHMHSVTLSAQENRLDTGTDGGSQQEHGRDAHQGDRRRSFPDSGSEIGSGSPRSNHSSGRGRLTLSPDDPARGGGRISLIA